MKTVVSRARCAKAAAAAASVLGLGQVVLAQATLISSSATILHTAGFSTQQRSVVLNALPQFSSVSTASPALQLPLGALVNGGTNTTAKAGIGVVTSPGFLGLVLATGTSLTQKGNMNASPSSASGLQINFAASWMLNQQYGSPVNAGASFNALGSLPANPPPGPNTPSPTAFFQLGVQTTFQFTAPGGLSGPQQMRPTIDNGNFLFTNFQGPFALSSSNVVATNPSAYAAGTIITITGTFLFNTHNEGDEAMLVEVRQSGAGGPGDTDFLDTNIPAPGAAGVLAFGGLIAARRRRA
ncbi:MAG: hypothetical protein ACKVS8_11500 [Phycisphaerales bacterium]